MTARRSAGSGIVRLGLVQTALGAIVVLTTSTLNRVMVVELALPATLPGALVALHYAVQMLRPRLGYGSDVSGRRTPWIVGGMAVLALGGAAGRGRHGLDGDAAAWPASRLAVAGLPADRRRRRRVRHVAAGRCWPSGSTHERRAAAATIVWLMMIAGIAVTAGVAGSLLDPFSPARLVAVSGGGLGRGLPPHPARGLGRGARRAAPAHRPAPAAKAPFLRGAGPGLGRARRRGGSPSSSSSRCWPTAPRT